MFLGLSLGQPCMASTDMDQNEMPGEVGGTLDRCLYGYMSNAESSMCSSGSK
jgi:hypothetical protein